MAFRHRQGNLPGAQAVANRADLRVGHLPRLHQLIPGRVRVAPVQLAAQHRPLARVGIEHVMEREVLRVFPGDLGHAARPPAVAPRDHLDRRVGRAHRRRELDGLARRGLEIEAVLVVGRFVPDLPVPDPERRRVTVGLPLATRGVVAVRHPRRRFLRIARADAVLDLHVLPASVRFEVDADERLGRHPPAEVHELRGPDLVRLDAAPEQVDHRRTRAAGADAFTPSVEIGEDPAPPEHRRRQLARHLHHVVAPVVAQVIPGGLDGTVGHAERLHELHIKVGGQLEARREIDAEGGGRLRRGAHAAKRSGQGQTGRRQRRSLEERFCAS